MTEYVRRFGWAIRMIALTGPWQPAILWIGRKLAEARRFRTTTHTIIPRLNPEEVAHSLVRDGWVQPFCVPAQQLDAILAFTEQSPRQTYENPHLQCEALDQLVRDPAIIDVVRRYIGSDPVLYHSVIWRSQSVRNDNEVLDSHLFRYHFDVADIKSLALFVYLTDVDEHSGPHKLVTGTHHRKSLWRTALLYLDEDDVERRYPGRTQLIVGPRGTAFFEEQTIYHRQSLPRRARTMLRVTYTLCRQPGAAGSATQLH